MFAGGDIAVMTTAARTADTGMIEFYISPVAGRLVADIALRIGLNVTIRLTRRRTAVMAARTGLSRGRMIETRYRPVVT